MDRDPADREPLGLQLLRQVGCVQAGVRLPGEREDLLLGALRQAPTRRPPPVAMDDAAAPRMPYPGEEAPDVPEAQPQMLGGLGAGEPVLKD